MAEVKVPKLLHKMSATAQKAWYKKHGMEMPKAAGGKSAAQAKKDVGEINKKKARETAIAAAAAASKKNKELVSSSDRVRMMRKNADMFGGGLGGGLDRNRDIISHVRAGGTIKAGRLGEEAVDEAVMKTKEVNKEKLKNYVRSLGTKAVVAGKVPFDQRFSPLRAGRKVLKQEEAKPDASMAMTHTLKMKAMSDKDKRTLGKVAALMAAQKKKVKEEVEKKEEPPFTPDKKVVRRGTGGPMSQAKWLAKQAMMKKMKELKKEEVEPVLEQDDSTEKKEMAETQLHFIKYAAEEILEFIKMGGEIEEWYQNKLSKVQSEVESLHSYIEGEKRRTGMVEETEQVDEKINLVKAKMGDVIKDFQKSDAPQFKGKSMEKRREMAIAAKLGAERANEEVEQMEEGKGYAPGWMLKKDKNLGAKVKEKIDLAKKRQASYGKPEAGVSVKEEVVTEAEGTVAVTPKEKALAAHHGDPKKITYGDVIKARLKSVAAKKMGK